MPLRPFGRVLCVFGLKTTISNIGCVDTQYLDLQVAWDVLEVKWSQQLIAREPLPPMAEKACSFLDSRFYDSIVDVVVKSSEQIREVRFVVNWNKCQ